MAVSRVDRTELIDVPRGYVEALRGHLRVADFGDQHLTDCWLNVYNCGSTTDVGVVPCR